MSKKEIPLVLLKVIEPIAQKNLDLIQVKKEENTFYSFLEYDLNSSYCFKIYVDGSKKIGQFDNKNFAFGYSPVDESTPGNKISQGTIEDVKTKFESWVQLVREINSTPSIYDDNFTEFYSDYYFNQFEIKEEGANIFPFSPDQQLIIEKSLLSIIKQLSNPEVRIDDTIKNELITEIIEINNQLNTNTKNQVMKKITTIFGKLFKISKPIAQEIIKETGKQVIKKLIELGINYAPTFLENLK